MRYITLSKSESQSRVQIHMLVHVRARLFACNSMTDFVWPGPGQLPDKDNHSKWMVFFFVVAEEDLFNCLNTTLN